MNRTLTLLLVLGVAVVGRADEEDAKRLEGVWASKPPAKGRGRGYVFYIQGKLFGWESFQSDDGKPLIGHSKLYRLEIDPKAKPKTITLTLGKGIDTETRLGIYELDGDTLKVELASGKEERPKAFDRAIVLTRDKKAKMPKLDDGPEDEGIEVKSRAHWTGQVKDLDAPRPEGPITTKAEFEKVWATFRGKEVLPAVDFTKEFVLFRAALTAKLTGLGLIVYADGEVDTVRMGVRESLDGFSYVIAVFPLNLIDVVDGKVVGKKKGKK